MFDLAKGYYYSLEILDGYDGDSIYSVKKIDYLLESLGKDEETKDLPAVLVGETLDELLIKMNITLDDFQAGLNRKKQYRHFSSALIQELVHTDEPLSYIKTYKKYDADVVVFQNSRKDVYFHLYLQEKTALPLFITYRFEGKDEEIKMIRKPLSSGREELERITDIVMEHLQEYRIRYLLRKGLH